jgi:flagellar hook-length control protein FliK
VSFAAVLAGAGAVSPELAHAGATAAGAPPIVVPVDVPVDQAGFGAAVMVKVGALAGDGVQQATLTLNPAELGPIQVRIALDGQQATIDFGASHGRTRELLEAALASLATALRDDGLHLAGARVSDWPQAPRPDQPEPPDSTNQANQATSPWQGAAQDGSASASHAGAGQDGPPGQAPPRQHFAMGWPPGAQRNQALAGLGWGPAQGLADALAGLPGVGRAGLDLYA